MSFKNRYLLEENKIFDHIKRNKKKYMLGAAGAAGLAAKLMADGEDNSGSRAEEKIAPDLNTTDSLETKLNPTAISDQAMQDRAQQEVADAKAEAERARKQQVRLDLLRKQQAGFMGDIKDTFKGIGKGLADAAHLTKEDLSNKFNSTVDELKQGIKQNPIYQAGSEAVDKFGNWIDAQTAAQRQAEAQAAQAAAEEKAFETAKAEAKKSGFDIGMVLDYKDKDYLTKGAEAGVLSPAEQTIYNYYKKRGEL